MKKKKDKVIKPKKSTTIGKGLIVGINESPAYISAKMRP